jgi:hypothetical protein
VDQAGHCLVADVTARSIRGLWLKIIGAPGSVRPAVASAAAAQVDGPSGFPAPRDTMPGPAVGGCQSTA